MVYTKGKFAKVSFFHAFLYRRIYKYLMIEGLQPTMTNFFHDSVFQEGMQPEKCPTWPFLVKFPDQNGSNLRNFSPVLYPPMNSSIDKVL